MYYNIYKKQSQKNRHSKVPIKIRIRPDQEQNYSDSVLCCFTVKPAASCSSASYCVSTAYKNKSPSQISYIQFLSYSSKSSRPLSRPRLGSRQTKTVAQLPRPYQAAGFIHVVSARRFQLVTLILRRSAILIAIRRLISRRRFWLVFMKSMISSWTSGAKS